MTSDARPLAPYAAVLLLSYGGPDGPDAVVPFLRNATAGRGIPDERLAEVGAHYALFGGVSPINERNAELASALAAELAGTGAPAPVVVGNRNWHPFLTDTLRSLKASGARRVVCVLTSAYASYSSCRQYHEDVERALADLTQTRVSSVAEQPGRAVRAGADLDETRVCYSPAEIPGLTVDFVGPYAESAGFVTANADALVAASPTVEGRVLFVTHSIPLAMEASSGPGPEEDRYSAQHRRVAERVAAEASGRLGFVPEWELVFCSRSGPPAVPWLEPDVGARLQELAASGVRDVVLAPIGFTSDHMEVVYDLDVAAAQAASEAGIVVRRAATAGVHPAFVAELASRIVRRAAVARGEQQEPAGARYHCAASCCGSGRPSTGARPGGGVG